MSALRQKVFSYVQFSGKNVQQKEELKMVLVPLDLEYAVIVSL